jgi:hypothetical protein
MSGIFNFEFLLHNTILKAVNERITTKNNKIGGSLRLMYYYYTCPLVWFFQSKELQTEPPLRSCTR